MDKSLEEDLEGLGTVESLEDATYQVREYDENGIICINILCFLEPVKTIVKTNKSPSSGHILFLILSYSNPYGWYILI